MGVDQDDREIYDERARQWSNYDGSPVEMETGAKLILNPRCEYSRKRFMYRRSEVSEVNFMQRVVKEGDCVLDIGANIGYWTTILSFQVGQKGKVLAFEPNPHTYELLMKNIKVNNCSNVIAYNVGISDINGPGKLYIHEQHSGDDRVYCPPKDAESLPRNVVGISLRTLDSFKSGTGLERLSFIKVDVQGFEPMVLKGARVILKSSNPMLLIEFSPSTYAEAGSSVEEFIETYSRLLLKSYDIPESQKTGSDIAYDELDLSKLDQSFSGNIILKRDE